MQKNLFFPLTFLLAMTLSFVSNAQITEHIDNGSFENVSTCPTGLGQVNRAYWRTPTGHTGSLDLHNGCSLSPIVGVPANLVGVSNASSRQAYAGLIIGLPTNPTYREYIMDTLTQPLVAGVTYLVSFKHKVPSLTRYAGDDLGFYFSNTIPTGTGWTSLGVTPNSQNTPGNFLTDTAWTTYSDSYVTVGGEQYITIGAFGTTLATVTANPSGSESTAYLYIDEVSVTNFSSVVGDDTICLGDTAQINALGIDSVTWVTSNAPGTIIDTVDTIYVSPSTTTTYWAITNLGDTFVHQVYVEQPQFNFASNDTICINQTSQQTLSFSSASYNWSNGDLDSTFSTQDSGTYWVEVTINGCVSTDTFVVVELPFPDYDLGSDSSFCSYDTITLDPNVTANTNATANVTYLWSTGSVASTIDINTPGTYLVDITYETCTATDTIVASYVPQVTVDLGLDMEYCHDPDIILNPFTNNATNYLWSTGSTSSQIVVNTTGTYKVTVSGGGCVAEDSVNLTFYTNTMFNLPETLMYCQGDTLTLSTGITGPEYSYLWNLGTNDSSIQVFGGSQGNYWVQVSDSNCMFRDTMYVGMYAPIDVELGDDVKSCIGDSHVIVPSTAGLASYTYEWSNGETVKDLKVQTSGTYTVTVSDGNCQESDKVRVIFFEYPEVDLGNDTAICAPAELSFDVSNPWLNVTYRWYDGQTNPMHIMYADEDQTIWVRQTNEVCSTSDSLFIDLVTPPFLRLPNDTLLCEGKEALVRPETNGGELTYSWSNGTSDRTLITDEPGMYTLAVDDGTCTSVDSVRIRQVGEPVLDITGPEFICMGEEVQLDATTLNAYYYRWDDGSTTPRLKVYEAGDYVVTVTHACGELTDTVSIKDCECFVRFPNAFIPNPSAVNQTFGPKYDCDLSLYKLVIYNRWGTAIFETNNPDEHWDGTYIGELVSTGAYGFVCEYEALYLGEVTVKTIRGTVSVIR